MYSKKSAAASDRARSNREEGAFFEQCIEFSCMKYAADKKAFIEKTPEPVKILGKPDKYGQFKACFTKMAQPDFKGTVNGGRAIVFDAKCTRTDRIPISALSDEQRHCLTLHRELGAWSGVMLCFIGTGACTYVIIPIDDFLNAKELNGHKHWTLEDTRKYRVQCAGYFIDFLRGIMTA